MTNNLSGFPVAQGDVSTVASDQPFQAANTTAPAYQNDQPASDQAVPTQPQTPRVQYGGMVKEHIETAPTIDAGETVPIVETRENEAVPEEVSSWIEKLEQGEDIQLPQPVVQDDQVLVSPAVDDVTEDKIVLPMSEEEVRVGLHEKVFTGARWLAEWCVRLVKKFHGKVVYRIAKGGGSDGAA